MQHVPHRKTAQVKKQVSLESSESIADIAYYPSGTLQSRGHTLDGAMHGTWEFFCTNGGVMRRGELNRGSQVGIWRTFERAGRLVKETRFPKREE